MYWFASDNFRVEYELLLCLNSLVCIKGVHKCKSVLSSQIGSSPGFEDGEFEMAKLMRPAASFYDSSEDCLYFVDSEVGLLSVSHIFFFLLR